MGYYGSESRRNLEVPLMGCFWPLLLRGPFCELACDISATQKSNRVFYAMIIVQWCLQTCTCPQYNNHHVVTVSEWRTWNTKPSLCTASTATAAHKQYHLCTVNLRLVFQLQGLALPDSETDRKGLLPPLGMLLELTLKLTDSAKGKDVLGQPSHFLAVKYYVPPVIRQFSNLLFVYFLHATVNSLPMAVSWSGIP